MFRDCWGHPQPPLQILSANCHFAVIYRRSPVGLPVPSDFAKAKNPEWDAVVHHPMSGVTADAK